jgi:hypothetical protein
VGGWCSLTLAIMGMYLLAYVLWNQQHQLQKSCYWMTMSIFTTKCLNSTQITLLHLLFTHSGTNASFNKNVSCGTKTWSQRKAKEDQFPLKLVSERFRSNFNAKMSISKERSKEKKEGLWVNVVTRMMSLWYLRVKQAQTAPTPTFSRTGCHKCH